MSILIVIGVVGLSLVACTLSWLFGYEKGYEQRQQDERYILTARQRYLRSKF